MYVGEKRVPGRPSSLDNLQLIGNLRESFSWLINKTPRRCFNEPRRVLKRRDGSFFLFGVELCRQTMQKMTPLAHTHAAQILSFYKKYIKKTFPFKLFLICVCVCVCSSCQRTVVVIKRRLLE